MSIAKDEAERLYPIHRAGDDRAGFIQPAIDVLSQNAYAKGRTAEPCREQVEAVAKMLAVANMYCDPDCGEYDLPSIERAIQDGGDQWSYRTVGQVGNLMHVARMLLDAARDAVDEGDEE